MKTLVRGFIGGCFLLLPTLVVAQHAERRDSVNTGIKQEVTDHQFWNIDMDKGQPFPGYLDIHAAPSFSPRLKMPFFDIPKASNPLAPFTLYNYSSVNQLEGFIQKGIYHHFALNNFLTADINIFVSGYSHAFFQPHTYVNGAAKINLTLKLHNRLQLVGMGQISLREGINPKFPTSFGTANYYGAGIQIKVTDKVGFGIGVTKSYYRGDWTKQTYFTPVGY